MQNMTDQSISEDNLKIGIFGGAFNPVHNGHIKLAEEYKKELALDKVIFVPTSVPPHKSSSCLISKEDRLNMLTLALENKEKLEISDIEFNRSGKSYTYDTLVEIKKLYPNSQLYLIVGADQFLTFNLWYRYDDILNMVTLCTAARESDKQKDELCAFAKTLKADKIFVGSFDVLRVSSSEIREKIKNQQDFSSLVDKKVYNYIIEKGLYRV